MDPTTLVAVAAATVASLLGSLMVALAAWGEARKGERHAVERALLAERSERAEVDRAMRRARRIEAAAMHYRSTVREAPRIGTSGLVAAAAAALDDVLDNTGSM